MANKHLLDDFYVVAVMTNPERYKRRPYLFKEFMSRMEKYGANVYVVEGTFKDREFEVTDSKNPKHTQIFLESEIWHKENLINIGISRLPSTWKYVAWIDADIDFVNPDWMLETVHELQHHSVVQMFEDALDMGPEHEVMTKSKSFGYCYKKGLPHKKNKSDKNDYYYSKKSSDGYYWHPGYAWAATREAINTFGGLFDTAIVGAGDHHMACALIGEAKRSIPQKIHRNYRNQVMAWQDRASRLHKNIGYVKGTIYHYWHGKKRDRQYKNRWDILIDNNFDPSTHIHKDWQGVWSLFSGNEKLRDEIRIYFQSRNEDSIDKE